MPKKHGYEGSEWVGILVVLGFFYVIYLALVKREKLPQALFCSLLLSGAFYSLVPGLILVFGLDIFVLAVYGGLLGYRTATTALGKSQPVPQSVRPVRLGDYAMVIITIGLIAIGSAGDSIYASSLQPNVYLLSQSQATSAGGPSGLYTLSGPYIWNSSASSASLPFQYASPFNGSLYIVLYLSNDLGVGENLSLQFSVGGKLVQSGPVGVSFQGYREVGPEETSPGEVLSGSYSVPSGHGEQASLWIAGSVCLQTYTVSFVLQNNGTTRGSAIVQIGMDGGSSPAVIYSAAQIISGGFSNTPLKSSQAVFYFTVAQGQRLRASEDLLVSCGTHHFDATVASQAKS